VSEDGCAELLYWKSVQIALEPKMACLLDQMDIHFDCPFLLSWVVLSRDGAAKFLVVHGGLYGFEFGKRFDGVAKTLNKMKAVRHEDINSLKDIMP
jgi:hypothetical protein